MVDLHEKLFVSLCFKFSCCIESTEEDHEKREYGIPSTGSVLGQSPAAAGAALVRRAPYTTPELLKREHPLCVSVVLLPGNSGICCGLSNKRCGRGGSGN